MDPFSVACRARAKPADVALDELSGGDPVLD
jgi:hypothetical protein